MLGLNASNNADIRKIRQKVGLLFQYPEHQLFEETVFRDIAFGPRRMNLAEDEVKRRVLKAAEIVGLQTDDLERSPFELSGGQKRRAAIAGVLAMEPEILILDEPAAGLDPAGRDEILGYAGMLRDLGVTVILVSHSMEDISRLADRVLVLRQGCVHALGRPADVFSDASRLAEAGLAVPRPSAFLRDLQDDLEGLDCDCYSPEAAVEALITCFAARLSAEESKAQGVTEMFNNISLGRYYPGRSTLHRLDPRTKLISAIVIMVIVFLVRGLWPMLAVALLTGLLIFASRVPIKIVLAGLRPMLLILVFAFLLNLLTVPGGKFGWPWAL